MPHRHRKQRILRPHAPKNSAANQGSPEEHPEGAYRKAPPEFKDGHNTEKEKAAQ